MASKVENRSLTYASFHTTSVRHTAPGLVCTKNVTVGSANYVTVTGFSRTRNGASVPDYRRRIATGTSATGPYSVSVNRLWVPESNSAYAAWKNTVYPCSSANKIDSDTHYGLLVGLPASTALPSPTVVARVRDRARADFWAKATGATAQGFVILGEMRQTIHMLRHPFSSAQDVVASYYKEIAKKQTLYRRGKLTARSLKKGMREVTLETVFGWLPFVHDVKDIVSTLAKPRYDLIPISSYAEESGGANTSVSLGTMGSYVPVHTWEVERWRTFTRCVGAVKCARTPIGNPDGFQALGLGLENVISAGWELIPFSFVVDYFTNVGGLLSSSASAVITPAWSCESTVQHVTRSRECRLDYSRYKTIRPGGLSDLRLDYSAPTRELYQFDRSSAVDVPTLHFRLPSAFQSLNIALVIDKMIDPSRHRS